MILQEAAQMKAHLESQSKKIEVKMTEISMTALRIPHTIMNIRRINSIRSSVHYLYDRLSYQRYETIANFRHLRSLNSSLSPLQGGTLI